MTEFWMIGLPPAGQAARFGRIAEGSGWDGLGFTDTQNLAADPYVALTAAANATTTIRLGTAVTNPLTRDAAVTANAIATVHVESGGRAVLGIGRGDSSVANIGRRPATVATFEHYLRQVRGYLAGQTVDRDGTPSTNAWIAASSSFPRVPIDVAGSGAQVIAAAARQADRLTFAAGADPVRLRQLMNDARQAATEAGRDPGALRFGAYVNAVAHRDAAVARELARGPIATFARFAAGSPRGEASEPLAAVRRSYDMARHATADSVDRTLLADEFVSRFGVVGTPEQCREALLPLLEIGLDHLAVIGPGEEADVETKLRCWSTFGEEVLAHVR